MNPLAGQLNDSIKAGNEHVYNMLSGLGKAIYFPKEGILSQSAEATAHAKKYNATIGIATENGLPMHLGVIQDKLSAFSPKDLYGYAPPAGKPELRSVWREKMLRENPSLEGKSFSNPIVTNALTHGLSIVADLFAEQGDAVIYPDKNWENYELTFGIRRQTETVNYPLFTEDMSFNSEGLLDALLAQKDRGKAIVLLNFPNNPTGYTPGLAEGEAIVAAILRAAEEGVNVVVVSDDAYFGLFSRIHSRNPCSASWRICIRACWRSRLTEPPKKNSSGASASASSPTLRRTRSCWLRWNKNPGHYPGHHLQRRASVADLRAGRAEGAGILSPEGREIPHHERPGQQSEGTAGQR